MVVRWWGPRGLLKVVQSRDSSTSGRWSNLAAKSSMKYTAYLVNDSARCLTNGGVEESWIITVLSGWRSWMRCRDFPLALRIQSQCKWYAAVNGSYTPEVMQSLMICIASVHIEGGMGMFRNTQGVWGTVGILMEGKYLLSNQHRSTGSQEKPFLCLCTIQHISFNSSGHSHFAGSKSNASAHSWVKCSPGVKSRGYVGKETNPTSRLSRSNHIMQYFLSISATTDHTFFTTGL